MVGQPEAGQRIAKLTPLAEALAAIDALVGAVEPKDIDIGVAAGRILAADLAALADHPAAALALRDGWAVASMETTDAGSYTPALLSAVPQRVDAGQPLPKGADAVAPLETVTLRGAQAEALAVIAPGEGVLPAGADVKAGMTLRFAGERLRATDLALLSALGVAQVAVREPRIRLVRARRDIPIAGSYGWLGQTLAVEGAAVIADAGTEAKTDYLEAAFHHEASDAILVLGGTGVGMQDQSVTALAKTGRVAFHGVGLIPGETAAFGAVGARSVLLLPERFDAALAGWLTVGRHWLKKLGAARACDVTFTARLARKVTSTIGMAEVIPVRSADGATEPLASGYLSRAALARADGWILVPPESEGYPAGSAVAVRPLP